MFRRIEPFGSPYETEHGALIQHYGVVDLPSDGMIRSYKGVIDGLRKRGGINSEVARRYRRILNAGNPVECRGIILELNILLDKSPSPNRGRFRSGGRRWRSVSHHDSALGWDDRPLGYHDPWGRPEREERHYGYS